MNQKENNKGIFIKFLPYPKWCFLVVVKGFLVLENNFGIKKCCKCLVNRDNRKDACAVLKIMLRMHKRHDGRACANMAKLADCDMKNRSDLISQYFKK